MDYDTETIIDQRRWERETARDIDDAIDAVLGVGIEREIHTSMFDGTMTLLHPTQDEPAEGAEHAIARHLRGGRDFDHAKHADWHVVSREPVDRPGLDGTPHRIGTRIALNRSMAAPATYAEASA